MNTQSAGSAQLQLLKKADRAILSLGVVLIKRIDQDICVDKDRRHRLLGQEQSQNASRSWYSSSLLLEDHPRLCAVRAMRGWIGAAGIQTGPLFRRVDRWNHAWNSRLSDQTIADLVKRQAKAAGLDPLEFSGHSLRAGVITAMALAGVPMSLMQEVSGHSSPTVLQRYVRSAGVGQQRALFKVFGERTHKKDKAV